MKNRIKYHLVFQPILLLLLLFAYNNNLSAQDQPVKFTNPIYDTSIWVGENFTYDFDAANDNNQPVKYKMILTPQSPVGMTINENTGVVNWKPLQESVSILIIRAYLENDESKFDELRVIIFARDKEKFQTCAVIKGKVTFDNSNEPVVNAYVAAEPKDYYPDENDEKMPLGPDPVFGTTDANGNYTLSVPKGDYRIAVFGEGFKDEYYKDAESPATAEIITVACNDEKTVNISVAEDAKIYITSYPEKVVYHPGDQFDFTATAMSYRQDAIRFALVNGLPGMTIDPLSGKIHWVAGTTGEYSFTVKAYLSTDADVNTEEIVYLLVMDENIQPCATIQGYVKDTDGNPIPNVLVKAYVPELYKYFGAPELEIFMQDAKTDNEGHYSFNLPKASYVLFAAGIYTSSIFYDNAKSEEEATRVNLNCGASFQADFELEKYEGPNLYTVKGRVTTEGNGNPVQAYVFALSTAANDNGDFTYCTASGMTDNDGYYTFELQEGFDCKFAAYPLDEKYREEFYNNTNDWNEATTLKIDKNYDNINFTLEEKPTYANGFNGIVKDSAGNGIFSNVTAFLISSVDMMFDEYVGTVVTDTSNPGEFKFRNLKPGKYLVFANPYSAKVVPGFYKDGDFATLNWEDATLIEVNANNVIAKLHEIILPNRIGPNGICKLGGVVATNTPTGSASQTKYGSNYGLAGAVVAIYNSGNQVVGYGMSNDKGEFNMDNLANGTYTIKVSKQGFDSYESSLSLNPNQPAKKDVVLYRKVTGVEEKMGNVSTAAAFPNPVDTKVDISFSGNLGECRMAVSNSAGEEVMAKNIMALAGGNRISLDVAGLPAGTYMVRITGANNTAAKFMIVR